MIETATTSTADAILHRYRHLREISMDHHSGAIGCLSRPAVVEHARRLGLAVGQNLLMNSDEEMTLIFDLAIYTAREGRSRAIDRYAKAARVRPGSDEAFMLEAMRRARFSLWKIERPHATIGLVVTDLLRQSEVWLVDDGLQNSATVGTVFASRFWDVDGFAMTAGIVVPIDSDVLAEVAADDLAWRHADPDGLANDPRFATSIYRAAIDFGIMDRVVFGGAADDAEWRDHSASRQEERVPAAAN